MGLYSTNKVNAVAESTVEPVNEADQIIKEIEECAFDSNFGDIMEAAIQLHENDKRMFDALIECDFISATNEAVMLEEEAAEANEAGNEKKKVKIAEAIQKIFIAIEEAIKKAAANIIYKITDLVKGDKKLYDLYKPVLTLKNLEGFGGIADFAFPKKEANVKKLDYNLKSVDNVKRYTVEVNNKIKSADSKESIDSAYSEFEAMIAKDKEEFDKRMGEKYFNNKEEKWTPTEDWQIQNMLNGINNANETINGIKNQAATIIGALKALRSEAKSAASNSKGKDEIEVYALNKLYSVSSETCNLFSKEFKAYISIAMKQIAAYRKAAILCGRYALKKSKGEAPATEVEANTEAMLSWAIGESSDVYVAECLGY